MDCFIVTPLVDSWSLSFLVLALLLCVYLCYDDSYLMGFILSHIYFMVLLIKPFDRLLYGLFNKTFGPFYLMVLFYDHLTIHLIYVLFIWTFDILP